MSVATGYVRPRLRVDDPNAVYESQRGHALVLYRRIHRRPAPPTRPVTVLQLPPLAVDADDRTREPVNWGLVVAVLACLAFWGAVVLGLVVAV